MSTAGVKPEDIINEVIEEAETIADPLDGLVERARNDRSAPFEAEMLDALAALRKAEPATFESLRHRLRQAGCRVGELDKALDRRRNTPEHRDQRQVDTLLDLAGEAELFHTADNSAYADVTVDDHRETHRVGGTTFRQWLLLQYFRKTGSAPASEAVQAAINTLTARAHFDGPERAVYIRVGGHNGRIYLDLCDDFWAAVEIDADGWRVIKNPPVRFPRANGMTALPIPISGGSVEALRRFLNVKSDTDFVLLVACLLGWFRDRGPYPILVLAGERGAAKSSLARFVRALIDPNAAPIRSLSREERDLFIAANNARILAFDNISKLHDWLSDALCRLSTGGAFAIRRNYSDEDEVLFEAMRPIILTGIEDFVIRPDLADRAVFLTLQPIPEESRQREQDLDDAFKAERPRILGALLDAVATGLAMLPHTKLQRLPRMADFAVWASACEGTFWPAGTFLAAYVENRREAAAMVIEGDTVAAAIQSMMAAEPTWSGTATALLGVLNDKVGEAVIKSKSWPVNARTLSDCLRQVAPSLRGLGVNITFLGPKGKRRQRMIEIALMKPNRTATENGGQSASASSAIDPEAPETTGFAPSGGRTVEADEGWLAGADIVRPDRPDSDVLSRADEADARVHAVSGAPSIGGPRWRAKI